MLKLTIDYKMTKRMLNDCTLKDNRTWLLVCTRHCYFIPFNDEHPVHEYQRTETSSFTSNLIIIAGMLHGVYPRSTGLFPTPVNSGAR